MTEADATTHRFAQTFVDELAAQGCREVCLAPGSRSAPLAIAFARHPLVRVIVQIDERCCGFFALGMALRSGRPVALLCTSGTAAVEFHPAVVEAHHAGVPLVVCTADRPPELRDNGAGQTIDQIHLYGRATRWTADLGPPVPLPDSDRVWRRWAARAVRAAAGPPAGPVHLNFAFREPLTPDPTAPPITPAARASVAEPRSRPAPPSATVVEELVDPLRVAVRPVIVCGGLVRYDKALAGAVDRLAEASGAIVVAEPTSGLRTRGRPGLVTTADVCLRDPVLARTLRPDAVVRVGEPPTSAPLRRLLASAPIPTLLLDPDGRWNDPEAAATQVVRADPALTLRALARSLAPHRPPVRWRALWSRVEDAARAAATARLESSPLFEGQVVTALARTLPRAATLVVGQSLAIRAVDALWPPGGPGQRLLANRGASGIDGVVSTAAGVAAIGGEPTGLLIGDLSAYHDMNGLWALRRHRLRLVVVVLDNDGGGIFSALPPARHPDVFELCFGTPLGLDWERVAALYGLSHERVESAVGLLPALRRAWHRPGSSLVAVRFTRPASHAAHTAVFAAMAAAARDAVGAGDPGE
ncbi:MAG TPA: 2-succinyl-5-enolpyruvyl-6-hydroxy-3-cyclohexene-1-carboxylic-acid synthase [Verrucomicrobiae bacterium]|nr:2-succinyl-5-enolpyruvyl-6-hydroxy-3-cyclohexene-1-carboxylic-acid synthase [Verrucomicrobiae bacterium]